MIETIIFDLDGVIADSESQWTRSQKEFLRRHGKEYNSHTIKASLVGKSLQEGIYILKDFYDIKGDPYELYRERKRIISEIVAEELTFIEGFNEFHDTIKSKHKTCIGTSLDNELLDTYVEKLKLKELFGDHIYCINHVNMKSKPNPDIFLYAAKQLKSQPSHCIVIEDSPNGVKAAKRAGMTCIALTTTFSPTELVEADSIVSGYDEVRIRKSYPEA